ncbi:hypothetical protein ABDJ41_05665 [Pedobacter sp. ASV1-7]|uniref:hypothetical protein n=1 Tax=Pedobacter sp. ASV1-7 TaxID=3145237 RepID=UPI0032E8B2CC
MKKRLTLATIALGVLTFAACKKENEVPPKQNNYIIEYTIPAPTFLTDVERDILDAKRDEWDNL